MSQCPECQGIGDCLICGGTGQVTIDYLVRKLKWYIRKLEKVSKE